MSRIIFHIDVNSAFLSWSAVKLVMEGKPDIRLVPSVVSGDPSDRRSIITAASIPAKKLGIKTAQPVSMALRTCPNLVIVRGDWDWYKQCSEGFIAICRSYSPVLQQFSIDECFIDMSLRCTPVSAVEVATRLKDQVKRALGFTVNVGIGSNKLLAKMASDFEKPDKVHTLWESEVREKMWPLGVRDLLWVGKKTEERLTAYGIRTIGDLAKLGMGSLTRLVGQKFAVQLHENANGRDDSPVETERGEAKSISAERTFSKDLVDPKDIDRALFNVACIVAHRIRRHGFRASTVSAFVKYMDFTVSQKQGQTERPTDVTAVILNEARKLISQAWDGVTPIRQVGLGVSKLTHETAEQMSLFEDPKMEYYREWDRQYDEQMAAKEDARMLAYENSHGPQGSGEAPPPPSVPDKHYWKGTSGTAPARRSTPKDDALVFRYGSGEKALAAAKRRIKGDPSLRFHSFRKDDGTSGFEVVQGSKVIERHFVEKGCL
ncbi:MAG: DNA polymerase IV [Clostridia bacterium]|nr:DNA polymerase IV [Clostridia bacterium]